MVSSLNCPACGAPSPSADAARCEYCGSALTVTACPSCFGPMFAGMQFCPHCGAKGSHVVEAEGATLACPGCKSEMRAVHVGTTSFHECSSCASSWLTADAFSQLCTSREERGAMAAQVSGGITPSAHVAGRAVRYLPCPVCKKTMNRQNFGRRSGVIIDVCKGHGVWFEQGELQSVLAFIDSGGFELARQAEQQRQAEEHKKLEREFNHAMMESIHFERLDTSKHEAETMLHDAIRMLFS
jgi:Zn-finger nucleic acid-binding protein